MAGVDFGGTKVAVARAMYARCGFAFVRTKGMKNTVMRRTVAPAG